MVDSEFKSILTSIKKLIGIDKDYGAFDIDLIIAINSSFTILNQLGVGPDKPFSIAGSDETWDEFFHDKEFIELAKSYVYLRARLLFDPPSTGVLHEAIERQISEFEWRLTIQADPVSHGLPSESSNPLDHTKLINRDVQDQHPVEAITGLSEQLKQIPTIMTAEELREILLGIGGGTYG